MINSIYSLIMTDRLSESCLFYKNYFGFTETFTSEWYTSLSHPNGSELAFIDVKHETIPASHRSLVKGMIINIEVENAEQMYNDIQKQNNSIIIMDLKDEDFGQRHFMVQDPNNIIVDVIEIIAPSEEFQNNYISGGMEYEK